MSAGPDPGSEATPGRVKPKVTDALRAAAYEWIKSGSNVTSTSWTAEDAMS